MSLLMALVVDGDPRRLEEHAASDRAGMQSILDAAKQHGLTAPLLRG
jgi:hypothetical protein